MASAAIASHEDAIYEVKSFAEMRIAELLAKQARGHLSRDETCELTELLAQRRAERMTFDLDS
ncbi:MULTISPECIES: hypothetical protein [Sphingomonadales]|uniref:hypothetical protein n=1 Tax=Sphingomonadales TaxID=204457 RepID=UPI0001DD0FE9|nr:MULTISPECIES: hypothetical protein [Sphingomonadales]ALG61227.1 hypothetical protein WG74_10575 [Citromicrobium sp. JL477]KPM15388.1 hypothetical protein VO58_09790 [Citromicrobium sp. JL1351]KPM19747.1 hypothetical protein VM77_07580 [Citromicrobium sp. JL31]KPM26194.1 hypothetical protein VO57_07670 [Citromicrobium sp. JL2201]